MIRLPRGRATLPGVVLAVLMLGPTLARAQDNPVSVLDPRVTVQVTDQPLNQVLAALTRQTGFIFGPQWPAGAVGLTVPDVWTAEAADEAATELAPPRTDVTVSVDAQAEPLRQVLNRIEDATGVRFQLQFDAGSYLVLVPPANAAGAAPPMVDVDGYQMRVRGLTVEQRRRQRWQPLPERDSQNTLTVELDVRPASNLADWALAGLGPNLQGVLDGQTAEPINGHPGWGRTLGQPGHHAQYLPWSERGTLRSVLRGEQMLRGAGATDRLLAAMARSATLRPVVLALPTPDANLLTRLAGALEVAQRPQELVFALPLDRWLGLLEEPLIQERAQVTLLGFTRNPDGTSEVRLRVRRPVPPANVQQPHSATPNAEQRAQLEAMVRQGVALGVMQGPPPGGRREMSELGGGVQPLVALQGPSGRVLAEHITLANVSDDTIEVIGEYTMTLPAVDEPNFLIVSLVDLGWDYTMLPFAFESLPLPGD